MKQWGKTVSGECFYWEYEKFVLKYVKIEYICIEICENWKATEVGRDQPSVDIICLPWRYQCSLAKIIISYTHRCPPCLPRENSIQEEEHEGNHCQQIKKKWSLHFCTIRLLDLAGLYYTASEWLELWKIGVRRRVNISPN